MKALIATNATTAAMTAPFGCACVGERTDWESACCRGAPSDAQPQDGLAGLLCTDATLDGCLVQLSVRAATTVVWRRLSFARQPKASYKLVRCERASGSALENTFVRMIARRAPT